jgi:hypothetical protein
MIRPFQIRPKEAPPFFKLLVLFSSHRDRFLLRNTPDVEFWREKLTRGFQSKSANGHEFVSGMKNELES